MPTLRQWEYFLEVVDRGSFTAAADALNVSQPGLSHQMRALEQVLGGRLLERLSRGVRLTPMGRAVLPHARAAIADARRAQAAAAATIGASAGSLDVVTITSLGMAVMPGILKKWLLAHPGTSVQVHEHQNVSGVIAAMEAGEGDVAISPMPKSWQGPHRLIGIEEFVVAVHADHDLARAGRVTVALADLADEKWVQFAPEHGLSGVLERYAAQAGFTPHVAMTTPQTAAAPRFAEAGVGVALIPANIVERGFEGRVLRLDPPRTRRVYAFTRSEPDPLAAAFIDTAIASADLAGPSSLPV